MNQKREFRPGYCPDNVASVHSLNKLGDSRSQPRRRYKDQRGEAALSPKGDGRPGGAIRMTEIMAEEQVFYSPNQDFNG